MTGSDAPDVVNILAVDDRPENRTALRAILSLPAYRLVETSSGPEALRALLTEEFAVLLIDVRMPEMTGFELARAIKERDRTAGVPIVFMTAEIGDVNFIYRAYRIGAVDCLILPLVPEVVRAKVAVFADLYRQRKRIERQAALLVEAERRDSGLRLVELKLAGELRYRSLAEAVPNIIWTARPDGSVDYFNRRWFDYSGLTMEQSRGGWAAALHPDDRSRCHEAWRMAIGSKRPCQMEVRLRAADGSYRWHLGRAVPERGGGHGVSWLGSFTDIEDQKRAQAVLAEFKGTLDAVLDAVFIFDPDDWRFLYVNQGASTLLGYSRDDLLQMRASDFMVEHDAHGLRELLASLEEAKSTVTTIETRVRRRDGRAVPVEVSLQLIRTDGGRIVAIARDITERKHAQLERELLYREAVDAIRARDEFLSIASHELRTPLASLQLQIQMMVPSSRRDSPAALSPAQTRAKLEMASRQIERLSRLVSELMDVSRITAGRLKLELEVVDLSAVCREVIGRLDEEARRARSPVRLIAPAPVVGRWDRSRMEQIVTNLLTNAFKFGAGKPIELTVREAGPVGRLMVRDHGIGIALADVERIFHRYEQAISSRAYGGLGLGLYIVHQIVEAHGGTVRVESQPGAGSTFAVELPREPAPIGDAVVSHPESHPES